MAQVFPEKTYDVLVIDPPWRYWGAKNKWGAVEKFYPTMSDKEIEELPVKDWLNSRSVIFIWSTAPRLDMAINVIQKWDLYYRGMAFVWVKTKLDGTPIGAQGVRPSIIKPTCEFVLAASTQQKGRPLPIADEGISQLILARRTSHSTKPEEVQDRIEKLYPNNTKAEVFARRNRSGWDCYGIEL